MNLEGVAAIVTGEASGLGAAAAERRARCGIRVTIFDLNVDVGQAHAAVIGGRFERVDVTDETSVAAGLDASESAHGVARALANSASSRCRDPSRSEVEAAVMTSDCAKVTRESPMVQPTDPTNQPALADWILCGPRPGGRNCDENSQ